MNRILVLPQVAFFLAIIFIHFLIAFQSLLVKFERLIAVLEALTSLHLIIILELFILKIPFIFEIWPLSEIAIIGLNLALDIRVHVVI